MMGKSWSSGSPYILHSFLEANLVLIVSVPDNCLSFTLLNDQLPYLKTEVVFNYYAMLICQHHKCIEIRNYAS